MLRLKSYYVLDSNPYNYDHIMRISVPDTINIDKRAIFFGHTQYINDAAEYIYLEKRTEELPDIYNYDLPIISGKLKEVMDDSEVSNIFYKPLILIQKEDDSYYQYYVPVIKHIDCVEWDKSQYKENSGELKEITGGFSIDSQKVGNYKIFKIKDILNEFFIIDDELKKSFEEADIKGALMVETKEYTP